MKKYLPDFTGQGRDEVCVKRLLTRTAGLIPDNAIGDYQSGVEKAWERLYASTIKSSAREQVRIQRRELPVAG